MKSFPLNLILAILFIFTTATFSTADDSDILIPPLNEESAGCQHHLTHTHSGTPKLIEQAANNELAEFQALLEEVLSVRAETIKVAEKLQDKADRDIALTGADLDLLSSGIALHLDLREQLLKFAHHHECWLDLSPREMKRIGLTPEMQLKGVMISLTAALVLYDNYLLAISLYEGSGKLRRLINEGDPGYKINRAELAKVTLSYNSISHRARVRTAMEFYESAMNDPRQAITRHDGYSYLTTLIDQSPSYSMVREWSPIYVIGQKLGFLSGITHDSVVALERDGINLFSMIFGNTVGLVETRQGKLFDRENLRLQLEKELQAGDILLEKTPFRLTDKLIPGYWGHAALWVGTEQSLRELGIWEHPIVKEHHDKIRGGLHVVEALRSGVEMNPLAKFMNIDSIGILRKPDMTKSEKIEVVLQALRQIGKGYDFNFDVESMDKVYCSKLIYMTYHEVKWPVARTMGRVTFTPDDIATRAFGNRELKLITFYHDGKAVTHQPTRTMADLMGNMPDVD